MNLDLTILKARLLGSKLKQSFCSHYPPPQSTGVIGVSSHRAFYIVLGT